jgi:hypothetical protein
MIIEFLPSSAEVAAVVPPPKPSAYYAPEWYKDSKKFTTRKIDIDDLESSGMGIKSCVPFFDAMVSGYIQETWQDLVVARGVDGKINVRFSVPPDMVFSRDVSHLPMGDLFYPAEFTWRIPWIPKLPKGWSVMLTTPLNHVELPFECATGIIDSDSFYHIPFGNYPFYLKKDFEGIIPAGTPMYQIIPFKRESWKSKNKKFNFVEHSKREFFVRKTAFAAYRKMFHQKKEFE